MNRNEPHDNNQYFTFSFSGLLQKYSDWKLKSSLAKIKKYEDERKIIYECDECVYFANRNCKYRETDKGVNADLSAGIPCRFGRAQKDNSAGEPCDYRGG